MCMALMIFKGQTLNFKPNKETARENKAKG